MMEAEEVETVTGGHHFEELLHSKGRSEKRSWVEGSRLRFCFLRFCDFSDGGIKGVFVAR